MEVAVQYFEKAGKSNTSETLSVSHRRAKALGITQIVVASTHGFTGLKTREVFSDPATRIIAVSISGAFEDEGWIMTAQERKKLEDAGVTVLTCMHSLGDDVNDAFAGDSPNKIVRKTLYTFGQGMKVAVECALMAADAGLLDMSKNVISIAGTDKGADTSVVIRPAYTRFFTKLRVREILAKPR